MEMEKRLEEDHLQDRIMMSLSAAVEAGDVEEVGNLLKEVDDVDKTDPADDKAITALMHASKLGNVQICQMLLEHGAQVSRKSSFHYSPLMFAAQYGHVDVIEELVKHDAVVDDSDSHRRSALYLASRAGHVHVVTCLVENNANVESRGAVEMTPLIIAAQKGHGQTVEALLNRGARIKATDRYGRSPLMWACRRKHSNVVKALLRREDLDVNARNVNVFSSPGLTALMMAVSEGCVEIVETLLRDSRTDVHTQCKDGSTALMFVGKNGVSIAKMLLEKGSVLNHVNSLGQSVLGYYFARAMASWRLDADESIALVEYLLSAGAEINRKDQKGRSPLLCVIKDKSVSRETTNRLCGLLLKFGAIVTDEIHGAIVEQKSDIVLKLIQNGGVPRLEALSTVVSKQFSEDDSLPRSPLVTAVLRGNVIILKMILDHGFLHISDLSLPLSVYKCLDTMQDTVFNNYCKKTFLSLYDDPWPLKTLALIHVSAHLGLQPGREQRLTQTGLPGPLQKMLLYK